MKFKTNLKCNGCIETIRPNLEGIREIEAWSVDLSSPDKVLTVEGVNLDEEKIKIAIQGAGYKAVRVN